MLIVLYCSYNFYTSSNTKNDEPITKVSANDKLSIDSIKNDVHEKYKNQIDKLKNDLSLKDTIIVQKTFIFSELKKNYDSVNNKLRYYKQRLREVNPDTLK